MTRWYLVRKCSRGEFLSNWLNLTSVWLMSRAFSDWVCLAAGKVLKHLLAQSVVHGTTPVCMHVHTHIIIKENTKELQKTE